ncbi:MAG: Rpn family recombination-promoting nuclease/putative transposase [Flavobacterium sp.]|jgi:predicted transposase/invertase (TIGR01784 family)|nr:Rpn family recombination-promoting nuclease/putative transposase [Flavobacterium sp.]MCU0393351.1 Rpn family recombination-promoting nuclease/putative transposase [Thermoflexibacter sp.]
MGRVNPKIDLVFKKLFGSEENTDILLSLINAILPDNQQIAKAIIKNPYNVSDYADGKLSILDIKAEDEKGSLYDIEMQLKGTRFYGKRTLYYWAKMFGSQMDYLQKDEQENEKRKTYSGLNKCIVISLMDFEFFKDDKYNRCFTLKDRETNELHPDLDYLDLYFVELEKFAHKYKTITTILDRWATFLNNADVYSKNTLPKELAEIESIKKASEKLDVMYLNEKEREYYEAQQKRYLDENSRIQEAVDEAIEQTELKSKIEIAKNAILEGAKNEFISKITGLNIEQIEQLRHEKQ